MERFKVIVKLADDPGNGVAVAEGQTSGSAERSRIDYERAGCIVRVVPDAS